MQIQSKLQKNKKVQASVDKYVPTSSDKKRAIMMYFILGIMVGLSKKNMNDFEYYHLKQAVGRRTVFILVLIFVIVLLFLPIIKYLAVIPLFVLIVVWFINIKQARDGKYFVNNKDSLLALFSGIGSWFVELFNIDSVPQKSDSVVNINREINVDSNVNSKSDIEKDLYG